MDLPITVNSVISSSIPQSVKNQASQNLGNNSLRDKKLNKLKDQMVRRKIHNIT